MYVMNSSKREKMSWTKSRKRPGPKKLFFSFADKCLFPLLFFSRSFSRWFNFTHIFAAITIRRCSTATAKLPANSMGYFSCGRSEVSEACVSLVGGMTQLTAALMRFDKLSKIYESKIQALFLHGFPCFKRINTGYRFDGFLWNLTKIFLGYQCEKMCEAFLIFQILLLLRALMWRRFANIQFANFKIAFLGKQWQYRKSLTSFCSLSPTDWHWAVCLVVLPSRRAGNSV